MRRIEKDLNNIPKSLRVDSASISHNPAKTTNERRLEIISQGDYPAPMVSSKYDARYKMSDIKMQLEAEFFNKCAYCETPVEQAVVEHYRPKRGGYYWLAYSWDNLLLACPKCNEFKGDRFPLLGTRVHYDSNRDTMALIHKLGTIYDRLERPLVVNPEAVLLSELDSLEFDKEGHISSKNARMRETIEVCKLYRRQLCENRQKIWDDFRKELLLSMLLAGDNKEELRIRLDQTVASFSLKSKDLTQNYTAFRQFILNKSNWISDFVKEVIGK